jgi:hypothetical protein
LLFGLFDYFRHTANLLLGFPGLTLGGCPRQPVPCGRARLPRGLLSRASEIRNVFAERGGQVDLMVLLIHENLPDLLR